MSDISYWTLCERAEFLELVLDVPGVSTNTLSKAVLLQLEERLAEVRERAPRGLIIRSAKASGFAAGADIREFTALHEPAAVRAQVELGHRVFDQLEALPLPTVAVVHGFCLGGGLELALACRYRIGYADRQLAIGLPEVLLGIHPGYGGSIRSVRTVGVAQAMPMMLTGRKLKGVAAKKMGLLDALCDAEPQALAKAESLLRQRPAPQRPSLFARLMSWAPVRPWVKRQILAGVRQKVRREHYPAPYALIDLWARHGTEGAQALRAEVDSIVALAATPTAANLVRLFLLQERLKSLGAPAGFSPARVHVMGAGVMGADIAAWCAHRGLSVTLQDRDAASLERGLQRATDYFAKKLRNPVERDAARARLSADFAGTGVADADVVIEAIVEDLETKRRLLADLEPKLAKAAIIATNTSSIRLEDMATALREPARLVGLHFFNPVAMMPLVEIVQGEATDERTLQRAIAFTHAIDKLPLPCKSSPGFLVNRVLVPYMFEAMRAVAEGLDFATVDRAATDFGMPVGPIELADMVGLDVCRHVGEIVMSALGRPLPDFAALDALIAAGKLGKKTGAGLYVWREGKVVRSAATMAQSVPPDLTDRLMLSLANEAVACWREGLVADVDLLDAGLVFGSGYAPFRGGPVQACATRGYEDCVATLRQLAATHGERFTPDPGWSSLPTSAITAAESPKIC